MYANASLLQQSLAHNGLALAESGGVARQRAAQAFWRALASGQWQRFWARLSGRDNSLVDLNAITSERQSSARHYAGIRLVAIADIVGSEGREHDFDADFRPLQTHNRERWIGVAAARLRGIGLPPVELVQVDGGYYVRDGNHRISVAKAMGQCEIEAEVTVWH